jgi:K+-transporting ATPase KdpF subunit
VNALGLLSLVAAIGLLVYLVVALVRAEKF